MAGTGGVARVCVDDRDVHRVAVHLGTGLRDPRGDDHRDVSGHGAWRPAAVPGLARPRRSAGGAGRIVFETLEGGRGAASQGVALPPPGTPERDAAADGAGCPNDKAAAGRVCVDERLLAVIGGFVGVVAGEGSAYGSWSERLRDRDRARCLARGVSGCRAALCRASGPKRQYQRLAAERRAGRLLERGG